MAYAKIIPGKDNDDQPSLVCQGTRVVLEDGVELEGVTKIVLTAEVGEVWRAEIHCCVLVPEQLASTLRLIQYKDG